MTYRSAGDWHSFYTRSGDHSTKGTRSGRTDHLPVKPEEIDWDGWNTTDAPESDPTVRDVAVRDVLLQRANVVLRRSLWAAVQRIPVVHPEGREIPTTAAGVVAEMRRWRKQKPRQVTPYVIEIKSPSEA